MSDSLPTIDADLLTKAVCLAAAGTLTAAEADSGVGDELQNSDAAFEIVKADKRNPSLKSLETLSTSVSSNLGKLNHLSLDKSSYAYSPRNIKPNWKNPTKNETPSTSIIKKYSSRKNYKLLPPLIPNQIRTSFKKQSPKVVPQRHLVTLSHCLKVHSPQELKSMPVRPARYTTNYLFLRTGQVVSADKPDIALSTASASLTDSASSPLSSTTTTPSVCATNVSSSGSDSSVITATSGVTFPMGAPILFPFSQLEQPSLNMPAISVALTPVSDIKQPPRHASPAKLQPLFRLPFPVNGIPSNIILKTVPFSKETTIINKVKENGSIHNNQILQSTNLGDGEAATCNSNGNLTHQTCAPDSPSSPAVNTLKHFLVPVSTPTSEIALLTSFASPVMVTAKLAHSSTLTVSSRPSQQHTQTIVSPQTVFMAPDRNCVPNSSSPNIVASSGQVLFASPSFQLVAGKNSLQTFGTSRLRPPVVLTRISNPVCNQHNATVFSIVRFAGSQPAKPLNNNMVPITKSYSLANQKLSGNNAGGENGIDMSANVQPISVLPPLETSSAATSTVQTPASRTHLLDLPKPLSESVQISLHLPKPTTESAMSFQRGDKSDVLNFSKFSRTVPPSYGALTSAPLQSSNNTDSHEKYVIASPIGLSSNSPVCANNSSVTSETHTISSHDFQANPSSCTNKGKLYVSHTPSQISAPGSQQPSVQEVSVATPSTQHLPLTVLAVPPRLQQPHRTFLPESSPQLNKLLSPATQKIEIKSESGASCLTPTSRASKAVDRTIHMISLSLEAPQHNQSSDYLPSQHKQPSDYLSSQHKQPSDYLSSQHKQPSDYLPSQHKQPSDYLPSQHKQPSDYLPSQHKQPSDYLPPQHKQPSDYLPPQHKQPSDYLPLASSGTAPDRTNTSAPLSKEVAAAAMVSLSSMSAFSEFQENPPKTTCQNYISHTSSSCLNPTQTSPQFLIPSSDRSKLVISAAGIEHLQSLLKKQGISEGYFIITSPRVPPLLSGVKSAGEINAEASSAVGVGANKNSNLFSKVAAQKFVSVSSEKYTSKNVPVPGYVSMFGPVNMNKDVARVENHVGGVQELHRKEECLDLETEGESDNENSSSSYSRSSSAALVIETGEEDERMDIDRPGSGSSPNEGSSDVAASDHGLLSESGGDGKADSDESPAAEQHSPKLAQDATWETESIRSDDARQGIPQSPLSLSDLVRQQQNRPGFSRHPDYSFITLQDNKTKEISRKSSSESPRPPSSASHDFQFPMPSCPASSFSTAHQHPGSDIQAGFQHNMFTSHSSFSSELSFESNVHHMEPRISHNLEDVVSNASPKLMSNTVNASSPKSPLSVHSSQALDQNAPLNPPMTPNTMLINLLNRVPTPFLTNSQDLLSVPTSQENNTSHETDPAGDFEMVANKTRDGMYSGKSLDFTSRQNHPQLNSTEAASETLLYRESSRSLSSNTGNYLPAENALELIASSYTPNSTRNNVLSQEINSSQLSSNFTMIGSKSFSHSSYSHCNMPGDPHALHFSENFQHEPEGRDICNSFHCKSCPGPLLVTVNLDPESPKYVGTHSGREEKAPESLLETYGHSNDFNHSLNLQEHGQGSEDPSRMIPEKSRETDILRHLILNTSSTALHTLQPVQSLHSQQYRNQASSFNMSQSHHSQDAQFECRVESFMESESQHKALSGEDINQSGTFSSQDGSFLHIDHVHTQPSQSFDNSNASFQTSAHQPYENTASSSFDNRNTSSLGNQPNAAYIMQSNMPNDSAFSVQNLTKSNMAMPHDFMEPDRLQHLAPFRSEDQTELFYQHTGQSDMHHYEHTNQHQGLEYHLDGLPPSHQTHQYSSAALSHPNSSRMFSGHTENVEYMNSQYQTQYYDNAAVASSLPLFPQQCVVGSEAPVIGNTAEHPCNIPFNSAPRGHQLEFRFPPDDEDDDGNNIEKQPVLPSASFSPPSVADQAANTDPGGMSMYHGSFPNLNMYDLYMRGGNGDARGVVTETVQESGNFCVECNVMSKAQCKFHPCDYVYVSDTPILSHARLTLPTCLRLGISDVAGHTNNTGVYAKDKIPARTKFGPLIGSPVSCDKLSSTRSFSLWQTFLGTSVKVMDTSDENSSNWLMFLKPARVSLEQNLVSFQHGSSVYFVTRVDIEPGQELLYWFAKDYSQMLGITSKSKSAHHQLCPHCPVCKQVFPDRKQVHSHVRLQHPKPCTKKCSHCSRRFSQVSHLNAHITSVHLRVKKFVCPHCGKRFSDSSNFRKHVKSHNDERLFKCPICGKAFRQKAHLKLHMNTHMPVKNEQCGFCGVRFTRAFTRRQHELQHTKQNKIQCAHCDKVFYKQQVYKQHLKIHSNERKYVCSHCSRAFRTKANLTRHGPTCKQQKCVAIPPPPPLPAAQIQGDFLHSSHSEVSLTAYSNDASTTNESV